MRETAYTFPPNKKQDAAHINRKNTIRFYLDSITKQYFKEPEYDTGRNRDTEGTFKTLSGKDKTSISLSLRPKKNVERTPDIMSFKKQENVNGIYRDLQGFRSVCQARFVKTGAKGLMYARNGGEDVFNRSLKEILPINIFKTACEDLAGMHGKGIYLRDIKPENMVIIEKNNKQEVKYIDIDDAYTPRFGTASDGVGTDGCVTYKLREQREKGNAIEVITQSLVSGDQYAMLLAIMCQDPADW